MSRGFRTTQGQRKPANTRDKAIKNIQSLPLKKTCREESLGDQNQNRLKPFFLISLRNQEIGIFEIVSSSFVTWTFFRGFNYQEIFKKELDLKLFIIFGWDLVASIDSCSNISSGCKYLFLIQIVALDTISSSQYIY